VEHSGALGEQVVHLLVAVQDGGRGGGLGLELAVDGAEERDQVAGARSGGHRALLVLAEPGEHELLVAVVLVFSDLGEQSGLRAAGPGCVAFGGSRDVLERDLRGEQAAGPVSDLLGDGAAQHPLVERAVGDRGQSEVLAGGSVDPGAEVPEAVVEDVPAEQQVTGRAAVEGGQLLSDRDGLADLGYHHPFVGGAAQWLALDERAGQAVTAAGRVGGRAPAAGPQFHEFAFPHPGQRGGHQQTCGEEVSAQVPGLLLVQRLRPGDMMTGAVGAGNARRLACPGFRDPGQFGALLDLAAQLGDGRGADDIFSGLPGQGVEINRQQRVAGIPPLAEALTDVAVLELVQRDLRGLVLAQNRPDVLG
jgi:hypothetical protein